MEAIILWEIKFSSFLGALYLGILKIGLKILIFLWLIILGAIIIAKYIGKYVI